MRSTGTGSQSSRENPAFKVSTGPAIFMGSKGAIMSKKTPMPVSRDVDSADTFKAPAPKNKAAKEGAEWDDYEGRAEDNWYD